MKTSITETTNKILSLKEKISDLELQIRTVKDEIKEEISKIGDIVEELAVYIKLNNYPTEIYPEFGIDSGEYDNYKHIRLKIVYDYGYTDILGLTKEEFNKLKIFLHNNENN